MGIIVNIKPKTSAYPLCTKAGNFPYNNGGAMTQVETARIVESYEYRQANLLVLRPVIDKLVFEYSFQDFKKKADKDVLHKAVLRNIKKALASPSSGFSQLTIKDVGYKRHKELYQTHEQCITFLHKKTGSRIILQASPRKKGGAFLKCDLNPSRLGKDGMIFFRNTLDGLLKTKKHGVSFGSICKIPKLIKRIDIAVDLLGVDASDLEGRYVFKDKAPKSQTINNPTGRKETQYFVKGDFDKNESYWYNKKKQILEDTGSGIPLPTYGDALHTRYEYRIQETDKPISNLHSLLNHLPKVQFRAADYTKLDGKDFTHVLFLRYAMTRTLDKALETVPQELQATYTDSYNAAMTDIWNPSKIWDTWVLELQHLDLLPPEIIKKKIKNVA